MLLGLFAAPAWAQAPQPPQKPPEESIQPENRPAQPATLKNLEPLEAHRFFDKKNVRLFAGVFAARGLDFASTLNMRARGRDEILLSNDVVDNKPAFVAIELGATAVSIGISYWLHRKGHHRMERWVSIVHISVGTFGAARNYMLETRRPAPVPGPAPRPLRH